ncbi:multidrug ABC transporter permease [Salimicrobium jeotgali]|uniref:Multidrug ABC transporter permease n=1 Tax=Salimicrobium jeotgali TaxID=1230341 RepID=K2G6F5_9BACI|nr:ABC-2 transporter permease [Salimicrobium jeotgali]AKG03383.1 multidrug ABC transporter permease [Salimicrobium jeotgali]EKE30768.1 multidrug ABC transporter permease [Salimicrobium jeotgali]MBM7697539.1 ABC-2 type transport system permease protein [Salimicrobium jeotgali]
MFNLIRRDVILQKRQLVFFIPFILFFIITNSHPVLTFLVASIFIPFNAYAYDEKAETNMLLNSLPYTRTEIIASRYLGAIVYMVLAIAISSLALFLMDKPFTIRDMAVGSGLFLTFSAFTFPLFYIFKQGYIFTIVLISFLLLAGIGPPVLMYVGENLTPLASLLAKLSAQTLYIGSVAGVVIVYLVSWGLSHFIYQRKAF